MTSISTGLVGAPITKCVLLASFIGTIIELPEPKLGVSLMQLVRERRWDSLLLHTLGFRSLMDLGLAWYLCYQFRTLERQMGSAKFAALLSWIWVFTIPLELALNLRFPQLRIASGPLPVYGALLTMFYAYVPASSEMKWGAATVPDKIVTYVVGGQLLLSRGAESIVPAACGALAAALFFCEAFPLRRLTVPRWLRRCFSWLGPLVDTPSPSAPVGHGRRTGQQAGGAPEQLLQRGGSTQGGGQLRQRAPPPTEEAITALLVLGFDRQVALQALQTHHNNVEAAANQLLNQ